MFFISILRGNYTTIIVRLKTSLYFPLTREQYPTSPLTSFYNQEVVYQSQNRSQNQSCQSQSSLWWKMKVLLEIQEDLYFLEQI